MQPDNRNILRYGLEGVDYKINNGKFEPTIDPATNEPVNVAAKYPSTIISTFVDWDFDNVIDNPYVVNIPQEAKDLATAARAKYTAATLKVNMPYYWISTPTRDITQINQGDTFAQIVMGKEDVQVMFDKFVKDCKDKGIDKVIEEVNAKAKEVGLN
jgi:putative aldouronate transport system substrate-binding protein